jgi:pilus assembly protein Flp/PilA
MSKFVTRFLNDESGATAIEYGLIIALIATVIVTAFTALKPQLLGAFSRTGAQLDAAK